MNAADAFDIGSFDEDDVKGIKVRLGQGDVLGRGREGVLPYMRSIGGMCGPKGYGFQPFGS